MGGVFHLEIKFPYRINGFIINVKFYSFNALKFDLIDLTLKICDEKLFLTGSRSTI